MNDQLVDVLGPERRCRIAGTNEGVISRDPTDQSDRVSPAGQQQPRLDLLDREPVGSGGLDGAGKCAAMNMIDLTPELAGEGVRRLPDQIGADNSRVERFKSC